MPTLTDPQRALIRLDIGDGCDALTPEQMQQAYDSAAGDDVLTRAIIARWLWMRAKTTTLSLANGSQGVSKAVVDIYKERLDYWETQAGTKDAPLTAGVLNFGLFADDDETVKHDI